MKISLLIFSLSFLSTLDFSLANKLLLNVQCSIVPYFNNDQTIQNTTLASVPLTTWYYDDYSQQCLQITLPNGSSAVIQTDNSFPTQALCTAKCNGIQTLDDHNLNPKVECYRPAILGYKSDVICPQFALISYTYNATSGQCEQVYVSRCLAYTSNNVFGDLLACQQFCQYVNL